MRISQLERIAWKRTTRGGGPWIMRFRRSLAHRNRAARPVDRREFLLLGYAYQIGAVPLSGDAIAIAIASTAKPSP
ncbi:MAG: hypothetical protein R3D52_04970 [Xanthobacteraceae bacterium]